MPAITVTHGDGLAIDFERLSDLPGSQNVEGLLLLIGYRRVLFAETVHVLQQRSPFLTAVLSTGGGLAFAGDLDRYFRAYDVRTGKTLWQSRLGTSVQGFPVSFSADGKQYIAVTTGLGGGSPRNVPRLLSPEIQHPSSGNALYVFELPE